METMTSRILPIARYTIAWLMVVIRSTVLGPGAILLMVLAIWSNGSFEAFAWRILEQAKVLQDTRSATDGFLILPRCDAPRPTYLPPADGSAKVVAGDPGLILCAPAGEKPIMLVKAARSAGTQLLTLYLVLVAALTVLQLIFAMPRWRGPVAKPSQAS